MPQSARRPVRLGVTHLDTREVPAGLYLDPATRILTVSGEVGNDYAQVHFAVKTDTTGGAARQVPDTSLIEAVVSSSTGSTSLKQYPAADVKALAFNGKGGNDVFINGTGLPVKSSTAPGGTVSGSVLEGSPTNNNPSEVADVGVFVTGPTGQVSVDYLYCGAGYKGQLGFYRLDGMDAYPTGSPAYIKEAARRALSNSAAGAAVIDHRVEGARFGANLPWEGFLNSGPYAGPKPVQLAPAARYGAILVPNGGLSDIYVNPSAGGSLRPLFSVPAANPYPVSPQMLGQMGDVTGTGTTFAFEDLRLDEGSDRDYNDIVFQVTGARATATPVREVVNSSRDFTTTPVGQSLINYAVSRQAADTTPNGGFTSGTFVVGSSGKVGVDYLFDSGGYVGQMGVFSLQGMGKYAPGSAEFIREATRRVLSESVLGHLVVDDYTQGARSTTGNSLLKSSNQGAYQGIRTVSMTPGDTVGFILVPNGGLGEAFVNPGVTAARRPLFSMPEANPGGLAQFGKVDAAGEVLAFEDVRLDATETAASDRDFNDLTFRTYGLTAAAATLRVSSLVAAGKDWTVTPLGVDLATNSRQTW